jgi:hypothetical protein
MDVEVKYEKAFSKWRHLVMSGGYQHRKRKLESLDRSLESVLAAASASDSEQSDGEREGEVDDVFTDDYQGDGDLWFAPHL